MSTPPDSPLPPAGSPARRRRASRQQGGLPGFDDLKPREARSRDDELQYFMVHTDCVQCGRVVQAPVDKLHYNLRCPSCGARMHMGEDGSWHPGVHPSMRAEPAARPRQPSTRFKRSKSRPSSVPPFLRRRSVQLVVLLGLVAGLTFAGIQMTSTRAPQLPENLEARVSLVGDAILQNDAQQLAYLAHPESDGDSATWMQRVRSRIGESGPSAVVTGSRGKVLFSNWGEGLSAVTLEFLHGNRAQFGTVTFWKLDDDGFWTLDGRRTLNELDSRGFSGGSDEEEDIEDEPGQQPEEAGNTIIIVEPGQDTVQP